LSRGSGGIGLSRGITYSHMEHRTKAIAHSRFAYMEVPPRSHTSIGVFILQSPTSSGKVVVNWNVIRIIVIYLGFMRTVGYWS